MMRDFFINYRNKIVIFWFFSLGINFAVRTLEVKHDLEDCEERVS
jgi:hypothetical protein